MTILQIKNNLLDFEKDELIGLIISACKTSSIIKPHFLRNWATGQIAKSFTAIFRKSLKNHLSQKIHLTSAMPQIL